MATPAIQYAVKRITTFIAPNMGRYALVSLPFRTAEKAALHIASSGKFRPYFSRVQTETEMVKLFGCSPRADFRKFIHDFANVLGVFRADIDSLSFFSDPGSKPRLDSTTEEIYTSLTKNAAFRKLKLYEDWIYLHRRLVLQLLRREYPNVFEPEVPIAIVVAPPAPQPAQAPVRLDLGYINRFRAQSFVGADPKQPIMEPLPELTEVHIPDPGRIRILVIDDFIPIAKAVYRSLASCAAIKIPSSAIPAREVKDFEALVQEEGSALLFSATIKEDIVIILDFIKRAGINVIITDFNYDEAAAGGIRTGEDLIKRLRESGFQGFIIGMTGRPPDNTKPFYSAGAHLVVEKPFPEGFSFTNLFT